MSQISKNTALVGTLAFAAKVAAHGFVTGIVADGQYNLGYDPGFQYKQPPPTVAGWSMPQVHDIGFVSDINGPDIICHRAATPGGAYVKVAAGGTLQFQWTAWPESHHGPMIDYLAPCPGGDCTNVDKTALKFIKVAEAGLINGTIAPGKWASDEMIANNNTWSVNVPSSIAPGKYVWRHETIALHGAFQEQGAQAYPQCVNLEITGSGSNALSGGVSAETFYSWQDPGILVGIYQTLSSYVIPGPKLMQGGGSSSPQPSTTTISGAPFPTANSTSPIGATGSGIVPPAPKPTTTSSGGPTGGRPTRPRPSGGANAPAGSVSTTATPAAPTQVVQPAPEQPEQPSWPSWPSPPSQPQTPDAPAPGIGYDTPAPSNNPPVSFTSTYTGRIGKPTKFTCYAEE